MALHRTVSLDPTPAGIAIDATGRIEIRARGSEQHFEVGMDAALAGNLYLHNLATDLPAGVDPLCNLRTIEIRDSSGNVVLEKARLFSD
jgi:hypothetical protein